VHGTPAADHKTCNGTDIRSHITATPVKITEVKEAVCEDRHAEGTYQMLGQWDSCLSS